MTSKQVFEIDELEMSTELDDLLPSRYELTVFSDEFLNRSKLF